MRRKCGGYDEDPAQWPLNPRSADQRLANELLPGGGYRTSAEIDADGEALGGAVASEMAGNTIDFRKLSFSEQIGHGSRCDIYIIFHAIV